MLSERAKAMARSMVVDGLSATDAYKRVGYRGKNPSNAANNITRKDDFKRYCQYMRDLETNAVLAVKVHTYEQILEEVQRLIDEPLTTARDKLAALKLLGSGKTITAWKDVQEVTVNAHESFITDDADRSPTRLG